MFQSSTFAYIILPCCIWCTCRHHSEWAVSTEGQTQPWFLSFSPAGSLPSTTQPRGRWLYRTNRQRPCNHCNFQVPGFPRRGSVRWPCHHSNPELGSGPGPWDGGAGGAGGGDFAGPDAECQNQSNCSMHRAGMEQQRVVSRPRRETGIYQNLLLSCK